MRIDKQIDDIAAWADQDPVFSDLTVQQNNEGVPTTQVKLRGELNVDDVDQLFEALTACLLYTSPSPRD